MSNPGPDTVQRIEGKVARILNKRELVLNLGLEAGVSEGMKFAVLNRYGAEIRDPDTDETLGSVEVPKVLLRIVRVYPRMSVARTYRTQRRNVGGALVTPLQLFQAEKWVDVPETFDAGEKTYQEELHESDSIVKVGDPVVEVLGDEFD